MTTASSTLRGLGVFLLMTLHVATASSQSGFVTLEGRDFKLDGQDFYPLVMNYGIDFMSNTVHPNEAQHPSEILISPASHTDESILGYFEYADQAGFDQQFVEHFQKINDMGFNTIRLLNALPFMRRESLNGPRHYSMRVRHNYLQWSPDPVEYLVDLDAPYFQSSASSRLFSLIRHVLDLADDAGLKVILLCADDVGEPTQQLTLATDQNAVDWYADYLHELGEALQGHPALLAYDLWNEPIWTNLDLLALTKEQVCDHTTQWYDRLKNADPEHLVTLGGAMHHELGSWDPAVMKLDFYSPHAYPVPNVLFNYDLNNAFEAFKAEIYWLGADCPMPYLIGETGFVAENDGVDPLDALDGCNGEHLDPAPAYDMRPWMDGTEEQQAAFALMSLNAVRDYRGSGYSWWDFQNNRSNWLLVQNEHPDDPMKWFQGNLFALLKFGNDVPITAPAVPCALPEWSEPNPWRDKIAVSTFANYDPGEAPNALPAPPASYGSWYCTGGVVYRQYTIEDEATSEPIQHALATVEWFYRTADPWDLATDGHYLWDRNTTDASGQVNIRKRDATNSAYDAPEAKRLLVDATGAEHLDYDPDNGVPWPGNNVEIPLDRNRLYIDDVLSGHTIPLSGEEVHAAWSSLTLSDVVVEGDGSTGGTADFKARDLVHVQGEFHAQHGAEAHLFTEPTFLDCAEQVVGMAAGGQAEQRSWLASTDVVPKKLVLSFAKPDVGVRVFPNPCTTSVQVVLSEGVGHCTVSNATGAIVYMSAAAGPMHLVDVSLWAAGEYSVRVSSDYGAQVVMFTKH